MNPVLLNLITVLRLHVGKEQLISSLDLAHAVSLPGENADRVVRKILSEALEDGTLEELEVPLCAVSGQGYFLAADIEEAQEYSDWLGGLKRKATRKDNAAFTLFKSVGLHIIRKS